MKSLVTGGTGFLGSHLCARLLALGHEVIALDDNSTGRMQNITSLQGDPRFTFVEHDVVEPFDFKVDWIFNLACPASPPKYQANPVRTVLTNVQGTLNGLRLAERRGARFFQASTSEVYGDPDRSPQSETYRGCVNTIGPRACYDEGKRVAETLCMDFHRRSGTDVRIVRIFNTYGPHMDPFDGRVVSNFIVQALKNEPLTLYGDGSQTRSFCYVDDLIRGFLLLMEHPSLTGPVNIGNPGEFTVKDLAAIVIKTIGSESTITTRELPQDDPLQRRPDISLAERALGFRPEIDLYRGLEKTIPYFSTWLASLPAQ